VTLTGTLEAGPRYPGSDRFSLFGYPSVSYRRANEPARFSAPDDGISLALYDAGWFRFGPVARFQGSRTPSSEPELLGLRKVRFTVEPGAFVEFWPTQQIRGRFELRHGVHGHNGFVANAGLDYVQPIGPMTFSLGPRLALGDSRFTDTYFGVTPIEAALNPFVTPFRARGGITSVGVLGSASYTWSPQWATTLYASYNRLVGDAGDSPITRHIGSPNQVTVGAKLSYSFTMPALF
jgi:outer membrane scaffolding protein for murein synthesis (MipA/OmpV family)